MEGLEIKAIILVRNHQQVPQSSESQNILRSKGQYILILCFAIKIKRS